MSFMSIQFPIPRYGLMVLGGALLLGSALPAQAHELKARTTRALSLHAGPSVDYPQVRRLRTDARLVIHGCLPDYGWCDVGLDDHRGWVDSAYLVIPVDGRFRPAYRVAPVVGVPIVHFAIGPYWTRHYHGQPWFDDPRYAPAIQAWRVQSRIGNTVIEYEERVPVYPAHRRPPPGHYPPGHYPPGVYAPPPAYRPAPVHEPPPVYRPAPTYGPSYEPPLYIPPSERGPYPSAPRYVYPAPHHGDWSERRMQPLPPPVHRPPVYQPPAYRPAPGYLPPGDVHSGHPPAALPPTHEINRVMPGGRSLK